MNSALAPLLLDEDASRWALLKALRSRGLDAASIVELGCGSRDDEGVLELAARSGRVLFTFNVGDFCRLHDEYQLAGRQHCGIIVAPRQHEPVGMLLKKIIHRPSATPPDQWSNRLVFA